MDWRLPLLDNEPIGNCRRIVVNICPISFPQFFPFRPRPTIFFNQAENEENGAPIFNSFIPVISQNFLLRSSILPIFFPSINIPIPRLHHFLPANLLILTSPPPSLCCVKKAGQICLRSRGWLPPMADGVGLLAPFGHLSPSCASVAWPSVGRSNFQWSNVQQWRRLHHSSHSAQSLTFPSFIWATFLLWPLLRFAHLPHSPLSPLLSIPHIFPYSRANSLPPQPPLPPNALFRLPARPKLLCLLTTSPHPLNK